MRFVQPSNRLLHPTSLATRSLSVCLRGSYSGRSECVMTAMTSRVHVPLRLYTLAPKYHHRDYFEAEVYAIWVHGRLE